MRSFPTIKAFLTHLAMLPAELEMAERRGEQAAGEMLVEAAKEMIGSEENNWPALTTETVARKEAQGWTGRVSGTDPLLARGELRASIGMTVDHEGVTLGSTDPIAPYHEHGTNRMPPRPFIGPAMFQHGQAAADVIAEHVNAAMAGEPDRRR